MSRRPLTQDTTGATALEFALVSGMLFALLFGGIEAGIMLWTRGTLQSVAAQTARCVSLGSPLCTSSQSYAVALATGWLGQALITTGNVSVSTGSECNATTGSLGSFTIVTITASPWVGSIIYPLGSHTEIVTACFPI